jgi:hypothetical protein
MVEGASGRHAEGRGSLGLEEACPVFPAVGEGTLRALVAEAEADEKAYKARVHTVLTSSYSSYYRRMLPKLLAAIEFKCNLGMTRQSAWERFRSET